MPFSPDQVKGKNILVIEDIYDSGSTLMRIKDALDKMSAQSIKYAIIFHKKTHKNLKYNFFADYIGFLLPDVFVFGYGMDYNELFREMSHLCVISEEGIEAFKDC